MKDEGKTELLLSFILHPSSFILSIFSGLFFRGRRPVLRNHLDLREQLLDARGRLLDRVAHEMKFGSVAEVEQCSKLPTHVRRGVLQRLVRRRLLRVRPRGGKV